MSVVTLDTSYGKIRLYDTDVWQHKWLSEAGVSMEDIYIGCVRELLAERPRGSMVDVGASFGCWSLALAGDVDRVYAIEPQRKIFEMLAWSLRENLPGRTQAVCCAAWDGEASLRLDAVDYDAETNFGGVRARPQGQGDLVRAVPLDDLVPADECYSFIKIDVEGAERQVINGALETIRRCRPVLFVEWDHRDTSAEGLRAQLDAESYVIEVLGPNFLCVPFA
jgi:FkbM family methyltransferase